MCIIFCEIVLCLLKSNEHEIEEKCMCFEKCFLELKKKMLEIIFMRNEIKKFFGYNSERGKKKWCRLMVKAFLLLSEKNSVI